MHSHATETHTPEMKKIQTSKIYEISVRGELGATTLGAFPGLTAATHGGVTVLSGGLSDQAALYGVLGQIEALGLELLEVRGVASTDGPSPAG
jgi:hypothetical protein